MVGICSWVGDSGKIDKTGTELGSENETNHTYIREGRWKSKVGRKSRTKRKEEKEKERMVPRVEERREGKKRRDEGERGISSACEREE